MKNIRRGGIDPLREGLVNIQKEQMQGMQRGGEPGWNVGDNIEIVDIMDERRDGEDVDDE